MPPPTRNTDRTPPRFAADVMLGKLARWLRLFGLDTIYSNQAEDDDLKRLCEETGRILLTRDRFLFIRMRHGTAYLVSHHLPREQFPEIVARFGLKGSILPPRCAACNGEIASIDKTAVFESVPPYVYRTQEEFSRCLDCGKIYWPGTHLPKITAALQSVRQSDNDGPSPPEE